MVKRAERRDGVGWERSEQRVVAAEDEALRTSRPGVGHDRLERGQVSVDVVEDRERGHDLR